MDLVEWNETTAIFLAVNLNGFSVTRTIEAQASVDGQQSTLCFFGLAAKRINSEKTSHPLMKKCRINDGKHLNENSLTA